MFFLCQLAQFGLIVQCANAFFSFLALSPGFDHVSRTISVHMAQDDSTYISRSEWDRVFSHLTVVPGLS